MEWSSAKDLTMARSLFERGSGVPRSYQHPPLYEAWGRMEVEAGDEARCMELVGMGQAVEQEKQALRNMAIQR